MAAYDENGYDTSNDPAADPEARKKAISGFYSKYLGREADQGGLNGWTNGSMDLGGVENAIKGSDEAKAYAAKPAGFQAPEAPAGAWNRTAFRDQSMSRAQGMTMADFIRQNPNISAGARLVPGSNDKVILPTGEVIDGSINADAQGRGTANGWTGMGSWNGSGITPDAPTGSGGGNGGTASSSAAGATGTGTGTGQSSMSAEMVLKQQQDEALRKQLIGQLTARSQQSLAIDKNDPTIRNQADAYAANEERAKRNYLADIAEQRGPNANLSGETRMAAERVGQRTGAHEADLVGREVTARRAEIAQALESMRGMLTVSQEMQLRKELATMDDTIARMKLQQDSTQFNADLGFRDRSLTQQGQIANNNLGFNYDQFDWERSPLNPKNIIQN
jgi:hypothetical protein